MNKQQIINKLRELNISSINCYPKKSFMWNNEPSVGCYLSELKDDFYFYNQFNNKIYVIPKRDEPEKVLDTDEFMGKTKYIVPMSDCKKIWEDKSEEDHVDYEDKAFKEMTLREYACIHLKVPQSGIAWLDTIINQSK